MIIFLNIKKIKKIIYVYIRAAKYPETARQFTPPAYYHHTCRLMVQHLPKAILLALLVGGCAGG